MGDYYTVIVGGKIVARGLRYEAADARALLIPGAEIGVDYAAQARFLWGMADAAYGCGATLDGDSYAQSARAAEVRAQEQAAEA